MGSMTRVKITRPAWMGGFLIFWRITLLISLGFGALVAAHQLLETVLAAREGAHDQLGVGHRRGVRGNSVCDHDAKVLRAGRP